MRAVILFTAVAALGPVSLCARQRVAVIDTKKALMEIAEGRQAVSALDARFRPALDQIETAPPEQRNTPAYRRRREDLQRDFETARTRAVNELSKKLNLVLTEYAQRKHYEAVLDVSDPNSPVLWFPKTNDITQKIIAEYDKGHPAARNTP